MPTVKPSWFENDYYATQKVDQHNALDPANPWTSAAQYEAALQQVAPGATSYDNFLANGNADNVSPNHFFNESYYLTVLAASSNAAKTGGQDNWTAETIMQYLKSEYNASAWDHYIAQGTYEGLNPSAEFDTNAYIQDRVDLLNSVSYGDRNNWTATEYKTIIRDAGMNAIMDMYEVALYGTPNASTGPTAVENPITYDPNWNPWTTTPPAPEEWTAGETIALNSTEHEYTGQDGVNTLFTAVAGTGTSVTLHRNDVIDGGANSENHLQVTMQGNFQTGFDGVKDANGVVTPSLTNIDQVDLVNNANSALQFNALNAGDIPLWNLINTNTNSQTSITNLSNPGLTVNIERQGHGSASIGFVSSAVTGAKDSLTIGLDRVGTIKTSVQNEDAVNIQTDEIENITLSSTGPLQNIVNLSKMAEAENLLINGTAALKIKDMAGSIKTVDGKDAAGNLTIYGKSSDDITSLVLGAGNDTYTTATDPSNADPTFATDTKSLKFIDMGDGNDTVSVKSINQLATVHGGDGDDTITFDTSAATKYNLTMDGVETLVVDNNAGVVEFDGTNMSGITTLTVQNANAVVILDNYSAPELTVNAKSDVNITANGVNDVDFNVQCATYKTQFTADEATSLTVNLGTNTFGDPANGQGIIDAGLVQNLTINSANSTSGLFNAWIGTNLKSVSNLVINGDANVAFANGSSAGTPITVGQEAPNLFVDATGSSGNISIAFSGSSTVANQNLIVHGSLTGANKFMVNNTYDDVTINTGIGEDVVDLTSFNTDQLTALVLGSNLYIDLGGQANDKVIIGQGYYNGMSQEAKDALIGCIEGGLDTINFVDTLGWAV